MIKRIQQKHKYIRFLIQESILDTRKCPNLEVHESEGVFLVETRPGVQYWFHKQI